MNESLLHDAFLRILPTCLKLSGWTGRDGHPVSSIDSRVRLAWDVALQACEDRPTRPAPAPQVTVQSEYLISYRGSGSDLATDILALLSITQRDFFRERWNELSAGLRVGALDSTPAQVSKPE